MEAGWKPSVGNIMIPESTRDIDVDASTLFIPVHLEAAIQIFGAGCIPTFEHLIVRADLVSLGVEKFNKLRAARVLPKPWSGSVGEFVPFDLTPCSRAGFASVTGQAGSRKVDRSDLVALCVSHDRLRALDQPTLYFDRLCTRLNTRFSTNRECLERASWQRIRQRNIRPDASDPEAVFHYDAGALAWGPVPTSVVEALVFKDPSGVDRFRRRCHDVEAETLVRPNLLW